MEILAFSDIHDDEAALESLAALAPAYDRAFICGDVSQSGIYAESVLKSFPNGLIIPGNWDNKRVNDIFSASPQWLHGRRVELGDGLNAVGFGYSNHTPFGTFGELSEEKILAGLFPLPIDRSTLLLLHCPPKNHYDEVSGAYHVGSESILKVITEKQPLAAFFGHVHEHSGVSKLGETTLVKLPPANEMRACSLSVSNKRISAEFISL